MVSICSISLPACCNQAYRPHPCSPAELQETITRLERLKSLRIKPERLDGTTETTPERLDGEIKLERLNSTPTGETQRQHVRRNPPKHKHRPQAGVVVCRVVVGGSGGRSVASVVVGYTSPPLRHAAILDTRRGSATCPMQ